MLQFFVYVITQENSDSVQKESVNYSSATKKAKDPNVFAANDCWDDETIWKVIPNQLLVLQFQKQQQQLFQRQLQGCIP